MKKMTILLTALLIGNILLAQKGYKPGDKAMDFKLKNIDGKMLSLSDYKKAKGFIVIFTCNHCPYSVAYEDRIIALDKKYKKLGYPVIAVNPNDSTLNEADSYSKMIVRAKEKGFTFPYLLDASQDVFKTYGATRTPHVFVLEKVKKKLIVRYIGAIDNNYKSADEADQKYVESAVDALLEGKMPDPNFTKAIGCSIKYKKDE